MEVNASYTEQDLKELVLADLRQKFNADIEMKDITFEVKSKQNFKSEWENAAFRATIRKCFLSKRGL